MHGHGGQHDIDGFHAEGWNLNQRLTRLEALKMFTIWPAIASFEDNVKGTIEVGKQADLVVLSEDPLSIETKNLLDISVIATFSRGVEIFNAKR